MQSAMQPAPAYQQRAKKTKTHADVNSCDSKILLAT